jgi:hypothetical protein
MKVLKITLLFMLIISSLQSISQVNNIFAIVTGDTITLWQTSAWRNCGAAYHMELEQNGYDIMWTQADTGDAAYCLCYFDLSVTLQLSEPGDYHADVYYTESIDPENPIYQGFVDFSIGRVLVPGRSEIIGQFQSECYEFNGQDENNISGPSISIYPQPVRNGDIIYLEVMPACGEVVLDIFTLTGNQLYSNHYKGDLIVQDQWYKEDLFNAPGVYLFRFTYNDKVYLRKITVL